MESVHHFSSKLDCNSTTEVPSLILRTALSAIPFVSRRGVDVQWFKDNSPQALPNSKELSEKWLLAFLTDRETFVNTFPSPEKFWFYRGVIVSIEWLNLVPRLRVGDCFEIHLPRWGLCHQVTEFFWPKCCIASAHPARSPCNVGSHLATSLPVPVRCPQFYSGFGFL